MLKEAQIHKLKEDLKAFICSALADEKIKINFDENFENNFFSWQLNQINQKDILLPRINNEELIKSSRAALDIALAKNLFYKNLNKKINFFSNEQEKFLNDFEKIRLTKKLENLYFGCAQNILTKIEEDVSSFEGNLSLLFLGEIFELKNFPKTQKYRQNLCSKISTKIQNEIKKLKEHIDNQQQFQNQVIKLFNMIMKGLEGENDQQNNQENQEEKTQELESLGQENVGEKQEQFLQEEKQEEGEEKQKIEEKIQEFVENSESSSQVEASVARSKAQNKQINEKIQFTYPYKIYSSEFDEVIFPQKLITKKELEMLYYQLELKMEKLANISRKMSLELRKKILTKQERSFNLEISNGILDRKKLTQIILNSHLEDIFLQRFKQDYNNCALTILLDNSGSMRGAPIVMAAMACKIIAEILEKFAIKVEIIGFTTVDWKGGKVRKNWELNNRPKNPGRLSELRHIIYKSFDENLKKSKINLGLMLKEGILKENIDGEALLFARSRLMQRSEDRKILMVISDGTPIDDSTLAVNDAEILSNHLSFVINKIEKAKKIELIAIGIGHDTSNFYKNSFVIKNLEDLGDIMIKKFCEVL